MVLVDFSGGWGVEVWTWAQEEPGRDDGSSKPDSLSA